MRTLAALGVFVAAGATAASAATDPYRSVENMHSVSTILNVLGVVSGLAAGGTAVAAYIGYDEYKRSQSPSEARTLRQQVQLFDRISKVTGIASGVFLAGGITTYVLYRKKLAELNKPKQVGAAAGTDLLFSAAPLPAGGAVLSLRARF